jgi:hypothetical protein
MQATQEPVAGQLDASWFTYIQRLRQGYSAAAWQPEHSCEDQENAASSSGEAVHRCFSNDLHKRGLTLDDAWTQPFSSTANLHTRSGLAAPVPPTLVLEVIVHCRLQCLSMPWAVRGLFCVASQPHTHR